MFAIRLYLETGTCPSLILVFLIVKGIKKLHEGLKIEKKYAKCVEQTNKHKKILAFEVEDLVWIHLNNDGFLAWKFGRFKSLLRI